MLGLKAGRIVYHLDMKNNNVYKYEMTSDKVVVFEIKFDAFDFNAPTMNDLLLVDPARAGKYEQRLFNCPTITACSPNPDHFQEYSKHASTFFYVDMWSREEIEQIGQYHIPIISKEVMEQRIPKVGPVLRLLTYDQINYDAYLKMKLYPALNTNVQEDIFGIIGIPYNSEKATMVSALYCIKPKAENRKYDLIPISEFVTSELVSRFSTKILDIINNSTKEIASSVGYLFEYLFLYILTSHSSDPVDSIKHKCSGFDFITKLIKFDEKKVIAEEKGIEIFVKSFKSPATKYSEINADSVEDFATKVSKHKNEIGNFLIRGSSGLPMVDFCSIVDKKIMFWQTTTAGSHKFAPSGVACAKYVIDNPEAFFSYTTPRESLNLTGVSMKGNNSEVRLDQIKKQYNLILQLKIEVNNLKESNKKISEKIKVDIEKIKSQDNELLNLTYQYLIFNKKLLYVKVVPKLAI